MNEKKIKAILTDFDQTLFDTHNIKPLWKQKNPDWDLIYSHIPEIQLYDGWRWVQLTSAAFPGA